MKMKLNHEMITGILLIGFNSIYFSQALKLPLLFERGEPGPIFYPLVLIALMYLCGILILIQGIKQEKNLTFRIGILLEKPVLSILMTALYILFFNSLGYWITTFFYSFAISILFSNKNNGKKYILFSLLIALIITISVWILFEKIFNIALPRGGVA